MLWGIRRFRFGRSYLSDRISEACNRCPPLQASNPTKMEVSNAGADSSYHNSVQILKVMHKDRSVDPQQ
jgi:hypothetical protein